ncbi:MAG TPA: hypothetical protein VGL78_04210 [Solirubrobacteraceae bacterium]|jgi:hypothetical protein
MLFLHAGSLERIKKHRHRNLGRLVQPRDCTRLRETLEAGVKVGVDNDAFTRGVKLPEFHQLLDAVRGTLTDLRSPYTVTNLLWVVVPDVPGDAHATRRNFEAMNASLTDLPVAFAIQPGAARAGIPFDAPNLRCLFLAGPRAYKESAEMAHIASDGKAHGLWLHGAPCNSLERARLFADLGCDSFDGTGASRFPALIPDYLRWSELTVHKTHH